MGTDLYFKALKPVICLNPIFQHGWQNQNKKETSVICGLHILLTFGVSLLLSS